MKLLKTIVTYLFFTGASITIPIAFLIYLSASPSTIKLANEIIVSKITNSSEQNELTELQKLMVDKMVVSKVTELEKIRKDKYSLRIRQANEVYDRLKVQDSFNSFMLEKHIEEISKIVAYEYNLCDIHVIAERMKCEKKRELQARIISLDVSSLIQDDIDLKERLYSLEDRTPESINAEIELKEFREKRGSDLFKMIGVVLFTLLFPLFVQCRKED